MRSSFEAGGSKIGASASFFVNINAAALAAAITIITIMIANIFLFINFALTIPNFIGIVNKNKKRVDMISPLRRIAH